MDREKGYIVHNKDEKTHQVLINQSLLKNMKTDIDNLRKDIDKLDEKINFIYKYIVNKKEREDARWFY